MSEIVHMEKSSRDRLLAVIAELETEVARLREEFLGHVDRQTQRAEAAEAKLRAVRGRVVHLAEHNQMPHKTCMLILQVLDGKDK